jgi:hypothetical protein
VHERLVRSGRGCDQVAVPRCELLERRQQLLALGAAGRPAQPLLGVACREVEPLDRRLLLLLRLRPALTSTVEQRSARSSRPEATRAIEVACSSLSSGARARICSRTARSDSRRKETDWQRERIVSGSGPTSSATRTITA